jgi:hypothetical protein
MPLADRLAFYSIPEPNSGCLLFTGAILKSGYGSLYCLRSGYETLAHRWAYISAYGPIPDGLTIDHLCRTRSCIEPRHLEAVTRGENTRRAAEYRRRLKQAVAS